ncbi:hypothetical protein WJX73_006877 [Symbiochloris irregularis]|uniref:SANT domain-containing protein n=1 Tax=Symbiochloris irregularis TaxID=706552 RepID=A0AAW1PKV5_9CHLO
MRQVEVHCRSSAKSHSARAALRVGTAARSSSRSALERFFSGTMDGRFPRPPYPSKRSRFDTYPPPPHSAGQGRDYDSLGPGGRPGRYPPPGRSPPRGGSPRRTISGAGHAQGWPEIERSRGPPPGRASPGDDWGGFGPPRRSSGWDVMEPPGGAPPRMPPHAEYGGFRGGRGDRRREPGRGFLRDPPRDSHPAMQDHMRQDRDGRSLPGPPMRHSYSHSGPWTGSRHSPEHEAGEVPARGAGPGADAHHGQSRQLPGGTYRERMSMSGRGSGRFGPRLSGGFNPRDSLPGPPALGRRESAQNLSTRERDDTVASALRREKLTVGRRHDEPPALSQSSKLRPPASKVTSPIPSIKAEEGSFGLTDAFGRGSTLPSSSMISVLNRSLGGRALSPTLSPTKRGMSPGPGSPLGKRALSPGPLPTQPLVIGVVAMHQQDPFTTGTLAAPSSSLLPKSQILSGLEAADAELAALTAKLAEIRVRSEEQGAQLRAVQERCHMAKLSALVANDQSRSDNSLPVRVSSPAPHPASPGRPHMASPSRLRPAPGPAASADVAMADAEPEGTEGPNAADIASPSAAEPAAQEDAPSPRPKGKLTLRLPTRTSDSDDPEISSDDSPADSPTASTSSSEYSEPANLSPRFGVRPVPAPRAQIGGFTFSNRDLASKAAQALPQLPQKEFKGGVPEANGHGQAALPQVFSLQANAVYKRTWVELQRSRAPMLAAFRRRRTCCSTHEMRLAIEWISKLPAWQTFLDEVEGRRFPRGPLQGALVPRGGGGLPRTLSRGRSWVRSDVEEAQVIASLQAQQRMDDMTEVPDQRVCRHMLKWGRFDSTNGLVQDPAAELEQEAIERPWTAEEKRIFFEKFLMHHKDFHKISACLDRRSTRDCVSFYYRIQKQDEFAVVRRKIQLKKRRLQSEYNRNVSFMGMGMVPRAPHGLDAAALALPHAVSAAAVRVGTSAAAAAAVGGNLMVAAAVPIAAEGSRQARQPRGHVSGSAAGFRSRTSTPRGAAAAAMANLEFGPASPDLLAGQASVLTSPDLPMGQEQDAVQGYRGTAVASRAPAAAGVGEGNSAYWTPEEEELFSEGVQLYARDHKMVAKHMGNTRSVPAVRAHMTKHRMRVNKLISQATAAAEAAMATASTAAVPSEPPSPSRGIALEAAHQAASAAAVDQSMALYQQWGWPQGQAGMQEPDAMQAGGAMDLSGAAAAMAAAVAAAAQGSVGPTLIPRPDGSLLPGILAPTTTPSPAPPTSMFPASPAAMAADAAGGLGQPLGSASNSGLLGRESSGGFGDDKGARDKEGGAKQRQLSFWSMDEKTAFLATYKEHGRDWKKLHSAVPGKTIVQIKNYYQNYKGKLGLEDMKLPQTAVRPSSRTSKKRLQDSPSPSRDLGSSAPASPMRRDDDASYQPSSQPAFSEAAAHSAEMVLAMQHQANLAALHGYTDPAALSLSALPADPRYSSAPWPGAQDSHMQAAPDAFGSPLALMPQRGLQQGRHGGPVIEPSFPTNVVIANPRASMDWMAPQQHDPPHQHRPASPRHHERLHAGDHESSTDALRRELMVRHQEVLAQQQSTPLPGFRIRSNANGIGGPLSGMSSAQGFLSNTQSLGEAFGLGRTHSHSAPSAAQSLVDGIKATWAHQAASAGRSDPMSNAPHFGAQGQTSHPWQAGHEAYSGIPLQQQTGAPQQAPTGPVPEADAAGAPQPMTAAQAPEPGLQDLGRAAESQQPLGNILSFGTSFPMDVGQAPMTQLAQPPLLPTGASGHEAGLQSAPEPPGNAQELNADAFAFQPPLDSPWGQPQSAFAPAATDMDVTPQQDPSIES